MRLILQVLLPLTVRCAIIFGMVLHMAQPNFNDKQVEKMLFALPILLAFLVLGLLIYLLSFYSVGECTKILDMINKDLDKGIIIIFTMIFVKKITSQYIQDWKQSKK